MCNSLVQSDVIVSDDDSLKSDGPWLFTSGFAVQPLIYVNPMVPVCVAF